MRAPEWGSDVLRLRLPIDRHGNVMALEGVSRCECGSKYWERDRCVDCGQKHDRERHG